MTSPLINERIEINPEILTGKAIIKGTRIAVEFILELLANDWTYDTILENSIAGLDNRQRLLLRLFHLPDGSGRAVRHRRATGRFKI